MSKITSLNQCFKEIMMGNSKVSLYVLSEDQMKLAKGHGSILPNSLQILWKNGNSWFSKGFRDRTSVESRWCNIDPKMIAAAFVNEEKNLKLLIKTENSNEKTYPASGDSIEDKVIIYQKNDFYCEIVLYDPEISPEVSHIACKSGTPGYKQLDILAWSLINAYYRGLNSNTYQEESSEVRHDVFESDEM